MNFELISDDELIYYIRQNKEEAMELLFFLTRKLYFNEKDKKELKDELKK